VGEDLEIDSRRVHHSQATVAEVFETIHKVRH
jgi:hypothetical protein